MPRVFFNLRIDADVGNRTLEIQCRPICAVALVVEIFAVECELFLVSSFLLS